MRNIFLTFCVLCVTVLTAATAEAAFDLKLSEIKTNKAREYTTFVFMNNASSTDPAIVSWKIRTYCDKQMSLYYNTANQNICNGVIALDSKALPTFAITYKNHSKDQKTFSFKLKGYDANGTWVHTEQKSFQRK